MSLNDHMQFDHVIEVMEDGSIIDRNDMYSPDVYDDGNAGIGYMGDAGWVALNGYSGQDRYPGPIMHPSEYIGGRLESDILSTPGIYVAVVVEDIDNPEHPSGWAILRNER